MFLHQPVLGFGSGGLIPVTKTYTATDEDSVDKSSWSFSSVSLGANDPTRAIYVGVTCGNSFGATVDALTVAGVSGTQQVTVAGGGNSRAAIWRVPFDNVATSGAVAITTSGNENRLAITVWRVLGADATAYDTATDTTDDPSTTIDVVAGGALLACTYSNNTGSSAPDTWVGATIDHATQHAEAGAWASGASATFISPELSRTVSVNFPGSPTSTALAVVSLKPKGS